MGRSVTERANDIIESIAHIRSDLSLIGTPYDRTAFDAIVRNLITIGEASAGISDESKALVPHIQWSKIIGLRNLATHEYFRLNRDIILRIANDDLNELEHAALTLKQQPM